MKVLRKFVAIALLMILVACSSTSDVQTAETPEATKQEVSKEYKPFKTLSQKEIKQGCLAKYQVPMDVLECIGAALELQEKLKQQ